MNRLKIENDKIKRQNLELKAKIKKLKSDFQKNQQNTKKSGKEVEIEGTYVPPSMDKNGSIWDRIENCLKLKKNMKKNFGWYIFKKLNESKKKIDNFVDKAFANNPTIEDKNKALSFIIEVLYWDKDLEMFQIIKEYLQMKLKKKVLNLIPKKKKNLMIIWFYGKSLFSYIRKRFKRIKKTILDFISPMN